MRDLFFTILIIWVLWRIVSSIRRANSYTFNTHDNSQKEPAKEGEVIIKQVPKKSPDKKNDKDTDKGEYVDYEEIK